MTSTSFPSESVEAARLRGRMASAPSGTPQVSDDGGEAFATARDHVGAHLGTAGATGATPPSAGAAAPLASARAGKLLAEVGASLGR